VLTLQANLIEQAPIALTDFAQFQLYQIAAYITLNLIHDAAMLAFGLS
jgi:hypothetical protein